MVNIVHPTVDGGARAPGARALVHSLLALLALLGIPAHAFTCAFGGAHAGTFAVLALGCGLEKTVIVTGKMSVTGLSTGNFSTAYSLPELRAPPHRPLTGLVQNQSRHFYIDNRLHLGGVELHLRRLRLTGGAACAQRDAHCDGGSIFNNRGRLFVDTVWFMGCAWRADLGRPSDGFCARNGGAIFSNGQFNMTEAPMVNIVHSTFNGARALVHGGAFSAVHSQMVNVSSSVFANNTAAIGGAIAISRYVRAVLGLNVMESSNRALRKDTTHKVNSGSQIQISAIADFVSFGVCPPGKYQPQKIPEKNVRTGKYSWSTLFFNEPFYGCPYLCPPGTFANTYGDRRGGHTEEDGGLGNSTNSSNNNHVSNTTGGQHICSACPLSYFSNVSGATQCWECPNGKSSLSPGATGILECQTCGPGTQLDADDKHTLCKACEKGMYQPHVVVNASIICQSCPAGQYNLDDTGDPGKHIACKFCETGEYSVSEHKPCRVCKRGRYNDEEAARSLQCKACPRNTFLLDDQENRQVHSASKHCLSCAPGFFSNLGQGSCQWCRPGEHIVWNNISKTYSCKKCDAGRFSSNASQLFCVTCPRGRYQNQVGMPFCSSCAPGKYENVLGAQTCRDCPASTFSSASGASFCASCKIGESSLQGSSTCASCSLGKYGSEVGVCESCPPGKYQNERKQTKCKDCPPGKLADNDIGGHVVCEKAFLTPEECDIYSFLNNTSSDKRNWSCVGCPIGGYCGGLATWKNLGPLFGWWKIPPRERIRTFPAIDPVTGQTPLLENVFKRCPVASACVGGPNPALSGTFFDPAKPWIDLSKAGDYVQIDPEQVVESNSPNRSDGGPCAFKLGYLAQSRLCYSCRPGWVRKNSDRSCAKCPPVTETMVWLVFGTACAFLMVYFLIRWRHRSFSKFSSTKSRKALHSSLFRLCCTHIQTLRAIANLRIPFPEALQTFLTGITAFAAPAMAVDHLKCFLHPENNHDSYLTAGDFYFTILILWAVLPLGVVLFLAVYWFGLAPMFTVLSCGNPVRRGGNCCILRAKVRQEMIQAIQDAEALDQSRSQRAEKVARERARTSDMVAQAAIELIVRDTIAGSGEIHGNKRRRHSSVSVLSTDNDSDHGRAASWLSRQRLDESVGSSTRSITAIQNNLSQTKHQLTFHYDGGDKTILFQPTSVDAFVASLVRIWYLIYPTMMRMGLKGLNCRHVGKYEWMSLDLEEPCGSSRQAVFALLLNVPMLLVFALLTPTVVITFLWRAGRDGRANDPRLRYMYGLAFSGYRPNMWMWELVILVRKFLLILIFFLFTNSQESMVGLALGVLIIAIHVHDFCRPYGYNSGGGSSGGSSSSSSSNNNNNSNEDDNNKSEEYSQEDNLHHKESVSLIVIQAVLWGGLIFRKDTCAKNGMWGFSCVVFVIMIIAMNCGVLVWILHRCLRAWKRKYGKKYKVEEKLRKYTGLEMVMQTWQRRSKSRAETSTGGCSKSPCHGENLGGGEARVSSDVAYSSAAAGADERVISPWAGMVKNPSWNRGLVSEMNSAEKKTDKTHRRVGNEGEVVNPIMDTLHVGDRPGT